MHLGGISILATRVITAPLRALHALPTRNLSSLKAPHESVPHWLHGLLGKERAFPFAISQAGLFVLSHQGGEYHCLSLDFPLLQPCSVPAHQENKDITITTEGRL